MAPLLLHFLLAGASLWAGNAARARPPLLRPSPSCPAALADLTPGLPAGARDVTVGAADCPADSEAWVADGPCARRSDPAGGMLRRFTGPGVRFADARGNVRAHRIAAGAGGVFYCDGMGHVFQASGRPSAPAAIANLTPPAAHAFSCIDIAVGAAGDGDLWIVDAPGPHKDGGVIRKHTGGSNWDGHPKAPRAVAIAVAPDGSVALVDPSGHIYLVSGLSDAQMVVTAIGGPARDVSCGAGGSLWAVDAASSPSSNADGGLILRHLGGTSWDGPYPGVRAVRIAAGGDNCTVWIVDGNGSVRRMNGAPPEG